MSKIKNKTIPNSDPFNPGEHYTEWTASSLLCEWINKIIEEKEIRLGEARVEKTSTYTRKRADITIADLPKSGKNLCVIECKIPSWDVYNAILIDDARNKANSMHAKYFATCNFRKLVWWNTQKANDPTLHNEEKVVSEFNFTEAFDLDDITQTSIQNSIINGLTKFLQQLYNVYTGKEYEPKHALDEYLISRLYEKIQILARYYTEEIEDKVLNSNEFSKKLQNWFIEQNWEFQFQRQDYEKSAKQTAYLLVNKILFYNVLQTKQKQLSPLVVPESIISGTLLRKTLQMYFEEVLKIDYETIYSTDFIDTIAYPDKEIIIDEIKSTVNFLSKYDFSKINYDVIGRIFERLIPSEERHALG